MKRWTDVVMLVGAWVLACGAGSSLALGIEGSDGATTPSLSTPVAEPKVTAVQERFVFPAAGDARLAEAPEVLRMLRTHGSGLLVVNFWATWCGPCVEELPYFAEVSREFEGRGVQFVGLSMDFPDDWKDVVPPFLKEKKVPYPNLVLYVDPNELVPKFSSSWEGGLPATFFYDGEGRQLESHLGKMTREELVSAVKRNLESARGAGGAK